MAKHMDAPDMQLLSLAEHFEEAYKAVPNDAVRRPGNLHSPGIASGARNWDVNALAEHGLRQKYSVLRKMAVSFSRPNAETSHAFLQTQVVWTPSDHSSDIGGWKGMYLALLKDATAQTAAEWVSNMPSSEIAAFLDFLVGTALPGNTIHLTRPPSSA